MASKTQAVPGGSLTVSTRAVEYTAEASRPQDLRPALTCTTCWLPVRGSATCTVCGKAVRS